MNKDVYKPAENLIHDIKLPLTLMYTKIQLLEEDKSLPRESVEIINSMKKNWYRVMKLLTDLADFEKISEGNMCPKYKNIDIVSLIREITQVTASLAYKKNISLKFKTNIEEKICAVDKEIIERILLNLISNSIKYIESEKEVLIKLFINEENFTITVSDNGGGIDKNKPKPKSGLGLNIVKELTELLDGELNINSDSFGTQISILLPLFLTEDENNKELRLDDFYSYNIFEIELSDEYLSKL